MPTTKARLDNCNLLATAAFAALFAAGPAQAVEVSVDADNELHRVSEFAIGLHFVYSNDKDEIYSNNVIADWAKAVRVGTARYPGGATVKYWDWENPTGLMHEDPWDPAWDRSRDADPDDWMSIDEYLAFVKRSGIRPLIGINASSGARFDRQADSVARAARLVQHVKDAGFTGALWYIGNEEGHHHGGVAGYAKAFRAHAEAMKAVDPDLLVFWNANKIKQESMRTFFANDGGTSDGVESHGKWPYGADPAHLEPGTYEEWLQEFPLQDRRRGVRIWRDEANRIRQWATAAGRPGYLVANNEYGLGKSSNLVGFNRYTKGLVLIDMLQEHLIGDWFSTAFWGNVLRNGEGSLIDRGEGRYRMNPVRLGFELLAPVPGAIMVEMNSDSTQTYGFAVKVQDAVIAYLLNKSESAEDVHLTVAGIGLDARREPVAASMVDTPDHFGEHVATAVVRSDEPGSFRARLPALSYTRIVLPRVPAADDDPPPAARNVKARIDGDALILSWGHADPDAIGEYRVYRGSSPTARRRLLASNLETYRYRDEGLQPGVPYIYEIVAVDRFDRESIPMVVSFTMPAAESPQRTQQ